MLRRRVALVTGSTSRFGLAIASEGAAKGMNVVRSGFGADVSRREQQGVRDVLSVAAASITGTVMPVDGGGTAK
jgi:NAD(P)-dependent dehydrogenase (short-subunit alcohol dehydrogenase family)